MTLPLRLVAQAHSLRNSESEHIRIIPYPTSTGDMNASGDSSAFFELLKIFRKRKARHCASELVESGRTRRSCARLAGVHSIIFTVHGWAYNEPVPTLSKLFRWVASFCNNCAQPPRHHGVGVWTACMHHLILRQLQFITA